MYIVTRPTRLSDLQFRDFEEDEGDLKEKARNLQIRRWRRIKHQLA